MIETRRARMDDVAALEELARSAYAVYAPWMDRPPAPVTADYAPAVRADQVWVAEDGGRVLGLLVLVPEGDALLLENIAVRPEAQGRGIGARLLALADSEAARQGMAEIRLYTNEVMVENLRYYPRHGYVETGRGEQDGYTGGCSSASRYRAPRATVTTRQAPEPGNRTTLGPLLRSGRADWTKVGSPRVG